MGLHSSPWTDPGEGAHVARAARSYMQTQVEAGHGCPITMTFAATPCLKLQGDLAEQWLPKIEARIYDPRNVPADAEAGRDDRHGDDREAGRLGRARQYDAGDSGRRRGAGAGLRTRRPQVLRLGADVRRVPRARAGAGRSLVFPRPALAPRRNQEPAADRPPQAQDGQRLQRVERDRAARRARLDGRRRKVAASRRSSRWSP